MITPESSSGITLIACRFAMARMKRVDEGLAWLALPSRKASSGQPLVIKRSSQKESEYTETLSLSLSLSCCWRQRKVLDVRGICDWQQQQQAVNKQPRPRLTHTHTHTLFVFLLLSAWAEWIHPELLRRRFSFFDSWSFKGRNCVEPHSLPQHDCTITPLRQTENERMKKKM